MKRLTVLAITAFLLVGCALKSGNVDDSLVKQARESAQTAIEQSAEWEASDHFPNRYQRLESRFEESQSMGEEESASLMVDRYHQIESSAYELSARTLEQKLNEADTQFEDLQEELQAKQRSLKRKQTTISDLKSSVNAYSDTVQALSEENQQLRSRVRQINNRMMNVQQDTVARLQAQVQDMRTRATDLRDERRSLKNSIEELETTVQDVRDQRNQADTTIRSLRRKLSQKDQTVEELRQENKRVASKFEQELEQAKVRQENDQVVVNLQERVLFDLSSAYVKQDARETLSQIAAVLKQHNDRRIIVAGHTDNIPVHEDEQRFDSNWELAAKRAINVLKILVYSQSIPKKRLSAVSYSSTKPLVPNNSEENRRKNRRVEIILTNQTFRPSN